MLSSLNYLFRNKLLSRIDILNNIILNAKVHDITDLFNQNLEKRTQTNYIVVHNDAIDQSKRTYAPVLEINEYHTTFKKWRSIAYHFYITESGKIYKIHEPELKTVHVANHNSESFAICLQGNFDNEFPKSKQLFSLSKLLRELKKTYPEAQIVGHRNLDNSTSCPGKNMNLDFAKSIETLHFLDLWKI